MAKAIWNGAVLADSDACQIVEGNYYFPPEGVKREHLRSTDKHTFCHWKGVANYYNVVVNGKVNCGAAWHYPQPSDKARHIRDYIAFWHGVKVFP
ncbi:MAG TPA: DUF427 domain-containing protein [Sulfuricaulis sp.]|nr:DUF427 domain-containing protein [Sulfuricaulis sp.]